MINARRLVRQSSKLATLFQSQFSRSYHFYHPDRKPFTKVCDPRLARPKPDKTKIIIQAKKSNIPQSVWKMNTLVKLIRGAWAPDALAQLKFSPKHRARDVAKIVRRAVALARMKYDAIPEQLVVKEVMINKGMCRKYARIMGRGRTGYGYKRASHCTVKVEKVDYEKEIKNAANKFQQKKWMKWQTLCNMKLANLAGGSTSVVI